MKQKRAMQAVCNGNWGGKWVQQCGNRLLLGLPHHKTPIVAFYYVLATTPLPATFKPLGSHI